MGAEMTWHLYDLTLDGSLLYVGLSKNPKGRRHTAMARWGIPRRVKMTIVKSFTDRADGLQEEAARIRRLSPPGNLTHNALYGSKVERDRAFSQLVWDKHMGR